MRTSAKSRSIEQPDFSASLSAATIRKRFSRSSRAASTGVLCAAHESRKSSTRRSIAEGSPRGGAIGKIQTVASSERRLISVRGIRLDSVFVSFSRLVERFKGGFSSHVSAETTGQDPLRLATAAILLEIAHADGSFSPAEDGDVVGFLKSAFTLDEASVRELLKAADEIRAH